MLRYMTDRARPGLVALYDIWPGTERVHSYNPGARTVGRHGRCVVPVLLRLKVGAP